jgi:Flp pilus assembly protein TadB
MADEVRTGGDEAPPAGEAVHLPGPSYLPALTAAGIAVAVVSVVISWILVAIGGLVAAIAIFLWVRETREDVAELPLEH